MNHATQFMLGPGLRTVLLFFALGVARRVILELARPRAELAGVRTTGYGRGARFFVSPLAFAIALTATCSLLVTVLLAEHLSLVGVRGGFALSDGTAQILGVVALGGLLSVGAVAFLRGAHRNVRRVGQVFFVSLALTLITGIFAGRPESSPFAYRGALFLHILSAEATLVLAPLLTVRRGKVRGEVRGEVCA